MRQSEFLSIGIHTLGGLSTGTTHVLLDKDVASDIALEELNPTLVHVQNYPIWRARPLHGIVPLPEKEGLRNGTEETPGGTDTRDRKRSQQKTDKNRYYEAGNGAVF